jgi:Flp pilus assembly protein TadG
MRTTMPGLFRRLREERGTTLVETAIASAILLVAVTGLMSLGGVATMHTENQGHLAARTTEYAQDKMEQLLALAYTDSASNTVVFPAAASGGTGLAVGGSQTPPAPVNGYVDWLANDGSLLGGGTTAPATWFYERVWQITSPSSGIKQISVTTRVRSAVGGAMPPVSTVTALKASQF